MSNVFLFFWLVLRQISSCFSTLSSLKHLSQWRQAIRSSCGFGENTERRAGAGVWGGFLLLLLFLVFLIVLQSPFYWQLGRVAQRPSLSS